MRATEKGISRSTLSHQGKAWYTNPWPGYRTGKHGYTNVMLVLGIALWLFSPRPVNAQVHQPVKWSFSAVPVSESEATLYFTASLEDGWHIYSQFIEEGGPLPTTFTFSPGSNYTILGKVEEESIPVKSYDQTFMMDIIWFAKTAVFSQKVKLHAPSITVDGKIEFMVCTDEMCLPPDEIKFSIKATGLKAAQKQEKKKTDSKSAVIPEVKNNKPTITKDSSIREVSVLKKEVTPKPVDSASGSLQVRSAQVPDGESDRQAEDAEEKKNAGHLVIAQPLRSGWGIFIAGLLGGLAAVLMPCIFPMLPLTISFFTRQSTRKKRAWGRSLLFGLSIIVIYVTLGLLITLIFGSAALNSLSTSGVFNILFFLLLLAFAASLFGAFEINLPASWVNKADERADRGGVAGIFFMAFTLALVSFSCTGPIIGTLLVEAASKGNIYGPAMGMLGFALALALPFTLFAGFPSWLKKLPKSGSWLNSVKIVLGFLELALALKFLSNVDLAYHWQWFDREVFLALWIIIFALLGLYLLGKLTFSADDNITHIAPLRLFFAIITLAFTIYMVPGLWGAPLKAIAAFLPPQQTQDFDLYTNSFHNPGLVTTVKQEDRKYNEIFHAPFNLNAFFDYEEGMAYARKVKKPVMLDFTGHACVNCRKMETVVWSDPLILARLQEDYVLIQLYVDDKTPLPDTERMISSYSGKEITTIGNKWSDFQASRFQTNSQPYYVLLDNDETYLTQPRGADYSTESFRQFLDEGLSVFNSGTSKSPL